MQMARTTLSVSVLALTVLFAAVTLHAQVAVAHSVNVPFQFSLAEKAFPASTYYVRCEAANDFVEILGKDKNLLSRVRVITRLAALPGAKSEGSVRLVFDRVGEDHFLSEVWIPGMDGLLLRATSERHQHDIVGGMAK
jgi:hypothetical protein